MCVLLNKMTGGFFLKQSKTHMFNIKRKVIFHVLQIIQKAQCTTKI